MCDRLSFRHEVLSSIAYLSWNTVSTKKKTNLLAFSPIELSAASLAVNGDPYP